MTKQEQIEILERAIPHINTHHYSVSVCVALAYGLNCIYSFSADKIVGEFLSDCSVELPPKTFMKSGQSKRNYCWPLTPEGDEARRQFLRDHIDRLRKELTTP